MRWTGPKDIRLHVERYLRAEQASLAGKVVVDVPAGSGVSSEILREVGALVEPLDLFPDFFRVPGLECRQADLSTTLPVSDRHADLVLCEEGIEHLPDPLHAFRELNRILKPGGTLLLTTPNTSNLRGRASWFLAESEFFHKQMPPNELDSIWIAPAGSSELYFGHAFLVGVMKLRFLGVATGFRIRRIHHLRVNHTALGLLLLSYPLILLVNLLAYRRALRNRPTARARRIYGEILRLGIDPRILTDGHLFVEFAKEREAGDAAARLAHDGNESSFVT